MRQDYRTPPRPSRAEEELTLTQDELTLILKEASSRESRPGNRDVATVDGALEAARELGIPDEHVLEAIDKLRAQKSRRAQLRSVTLRRRDNTLRYLGVMLLTTLIIAVASGANTALIVFVAMLIPLFKQAFAWYQASQAMHDPDKVLEPVEGECRVCGRPAFSRRGRYCAEHRHSSDR